MRFSAKSDLCAGLILLAVFLWPGAPASYAQAPREHDVSNVIPANLFNRRKPLSERLRFPAQSGDIQVFVRCETYITETGRYERMHCYTDSEQPPRYTEMVVSVAETSRAEPARVNGDPVRVWTTFSVVFVRENGVETMAVYPSQLEDRERYGVTYTAPQRYEFFDAPFMRRSCFLPHPHMVVRHRVSADGLAHSEFTSPEPEKCDADLTQTFSGARYIPAQLDGNFVEANVHEVTPPW